VSHMAVFQNQGAVPKRADTLGTRRLTWQDAVSGRLYRKHWRLPMPIPKSTVRGSVMGGAMTCMACYPVSTMQILLSVSEVRTASGKHPRGRLCMLRIKQP